MITFKIYLYSTYLRFIINFFPIHSEITAGTPMREEIGEYSINIVGYYTNDGLSSLMSETIQQVQVTNIHDALRLLNDKGLK